MANQKVKTEMKGDTSRWNRRAVQKDAANARRRAQETFYALTKLGNECYNCCGVGYFGQNTDCQICGGTGVRP